MPLLATWNIYTELPRRAGHGGKDQGQPQQSDSDRHIPQLPQLEPLLHH